MGWNGPNRNAFGDAIIIPPSPLNLRQVSYVLEMFYAKYSYVPRARNCGTMGRLFDVMAGYQSGGSYDRILLGVVTQSIRVNRVVKYYSTDRPFTVLGGNGNKYNQ